MWNINFVVDSNVACLIESVNFVNISLEGLLALELDVSVLVLLELVLLGVEDDLVAPVEVIVTDFGQFFVAGVDVVEDWF